MSNGVVEIPITGSVSIVRNRTLRGAINPATEKYKFFDPGGEKFVVDPSKKDIFCTAKKRSSASNVNNKQNKIFDPGGQHFAIYLQALLPGT